MIAGVIRADGSTVDPALLRAMAETLPGRDGLQFWQDGPAGLVAAARNGAHWPEAEEGGYRIAFDGRLDNRDQLLDLLGEPAPVLRSAPDADIALALFIRLGEGFLSALVGDFAMAIWRQRERRLLCARSATGWKPLFWAHDGSWLLFASEPRALLAAIDRPPTLNQGFLGEILAARVLSRTETPWQDIFRLAPGGALSIDRGHVRTWRWYEERYEDLSSLSDGEHVERFNALFDQALISCLRSERPTAAHLSGGLDSSSILCRATELHRAGRIDRPVGAISARYPGEPHDETRWSRMVEQHLGIAARVVADARYDIDESRQWCADTLHLPIRPNALGPTRSACRLMETLGERVLLTGEGGDDWMNGSRAHWPDLVLSGRFGPLLREAFPAGLQGCSVADLRHFLGLSIGPIVSARRRRSAVWPFGDPAAPLPPWIKPDWAGRIDLAARWREASRPADLPGFAQKRRYAAMAPAHRELVFDPILASVSRHGVELRHPFHDLRLIRFFMGASGAMLFRNGQRKYLLREAMRATLPEPVRTRQDKAGFAAPVIDAIAAYFGQRPPTDLIAAKMGWIDGAVIEGLFDAHRNWRSSGLAGPAPNPFLNGIWFCVAVDMWLENAFKLRP
ncbi:asparagine synthetase B family protein [Flavisphingomonas formosensis]|uniref:asparagine synthetase B family protein n=1 Tax=Flavisphingomonas formosensis TaxID=861534 RepID=UPI0018DF8729|nr:asparagine synthase-related protein [Sphingomonas formosensis]